MKMQIFRSGCRSLTMSRYLQNFAELTDLGKILHGFTPFSFEMLISNAKVGSFNMASSTSAFSCFRAHAVLSIAFLLKIVSSKYSTRYSSFLMTSNCCRIFAMSAGSSASSSGWMNFLY